MTEPLSSAQVEAVARAISEERRREFAKLLGCSVDEVECRYDTYTEEGKATSHKEARAAIAAYQATSLAVEGELVKRLLEAAAGWDRSDYAALPPLLRQAAAVLQSRATSENSRLTAMLKKAKGALRPFAAELDGLHSVARDIEPITNFTGINIRVGDLRLAQQTLSELEGGQHA